MALSVRNCEYFYVRIEGTPGKAYNFLSQLASAEVNLLAFAAVPFGTNHFELTVFPDSTIKFGETAHKLGWNIKGPQHALLVQGDDNLGALADIQQVLLDAGVEIYASSGVTDGSGRFGYVVYFKEGDHEQAARAVEAVKAPTRK